jgi:Glucoamylase and related glycosyl hydrolases
MKPLVSASIDVILKNQHESGAFIACPNFPTYGYSWFRDGAFCALALAQYGHGPEAWAFLAWGSRVILRYREKILDCISAVRSGAAPAHADCFHSRFTAAGREVPGNWGHHQLDGLGTWLWAAAEICEAAPREKVPAELRAALSLASDYLQALWPFPCSDCWEENEEKIHTYSLAAVAAGLLGYAKLSGDGAAIDVASRIRSFIGSECLAEGRFAKFVGSEAVDASLMGLFVPYGLVEWGDPVFAATIGKIESELRSPGVHRYRADSYYGGGEWVLLTAWLGLVYARAGEFGRAQDIARWVEEQASGEGYLPEQVPHSLYAPAHYEPWVGRWGEPATPLLWSHAQYLLLAKALS